MSAKLRIRFSTDGFADETEFTIHRPAPRELYDQLCSLVRATDLTRLSAFNALLAVAKAVAPEHPWGDEQCSLCVAIGTLNAIDPTWREWEI